MTAATATTSVDELLDERTENFRVNAGTWVLAKSVDADIEAEDAPRLIRGTCSTESLDRQGETVLAKGLDFAPFLDYGWFNDNHSPATTDVLGWPTLVELRKSGERPFWYTEGELLKNYEKADNVWKLAKALAKSDAPRGLGFSIEGKILQRAPNNRIVRAVVRNVAITNCPVNQDCNLSLLAKAFASVDIMEKALSVGYAQTTGGSPLFLQGTDDDSFTHLCARIKRNRPMWSAAVVNRMARYLLAKKQEG